jgi:hypothetical protein
MRRIGVLMGYGQADSQPEHLLIRGHASHRPQSAGFDRCRKRSFCEISATLVVRNFCDALRNSRDVVGCRASMTNTQDCSLSRLDSVGACLARTWKQRKDLRCFASHAGIADKVGRRL